MRQQDLRGAQPECRERRLVRLHETHLTDCGCGLQLVDRVRPRLPSEALDALGDCARRHEHHFAAFAGQRRDLLGPVGHRRVVEPSAFIGDERRPDLDDEPLRVSDDAHLRKLTALPCADGACEQAQV